MYDGTLVVESVAVVDVGILQSLKTDQDVVAIRVGVVLDWDCQLLDVAVVTVEFLSPKEHRDC